MHILKAEMANYDSENDFKGHYKLYKDFFL